MQSHFIPSGCRPNCLNIKSWFLSGHIRMECVGTAVWWMCHGVSLKCALFNPLLLMNPFPWLWSTPANAKHPEQFSFLFFIKCNVNTATLEDTLAVSYKAKLKIVSIYDPAIRFLGSNQIPNWFENLCPQQYLHMKVYSSSIHNQ